MYKKVFIKVETRVEATHKYPRAPKEVAHLRNLHRHTFIIRAQIEVKNDQRELEFYMVKDYLDDRVAMTRLFNNKSCEMINDTIYSILSNKYGLDRDYIIETSEDGRRSAISYYYKGE